LSTLGEDLDELHRVWDVFVMEVAKALRIDQLVAWLAARLSKE
jgi:hypothetical protein